jgi:HEAT repeat protein
MRIEALIRELTDPHKQSAAREELLAGAPASVEPLLSALAENDDPEGQTAIMKILVEINDARAAEAYRRALDCADENVRSLGATGLFRLGAEDGLQACLRTIDDAPDMLHFEVTPSVRALTKIGLPALSYVLPLLDAGNESTRRHAQKILEQVSFNEIEREIKAASDTAATTDARWRDVWESNGAYEWNAAADQRRSSIRKWKEWIENR